MSVSGDNRTDRVAVHQSLVLGCGDGCVKYT